jgi:hypothetical protein
VAFVARSSNPPAQTPPTAPKHLRPELEVLVRALAALPEPERSEVYVAVNEEARRSRGPTPDEPDLSGASNLEAWRQWLTSGPQGPIEDEGEPEFP